MSAEIMVSPTREVPRILGIAGYSQSGKTELLEQLIKKLRALGHRVAVLKFSSHEGDFDRPGSDTHRFSQAGASLTGFIGSRGIHFSQEGTFTQLPEWLTLAAENADVLLVEGRYLPGSLRILMGREDQQGSSASKIDPERVDYHLTDYPVSPATIDQIVKDLLSPERDNPSSQQTRNVSLSVEGNLTHLKPFVQDLFAEVVSGMVRALGGLDADGSISLKIGPASK